MPVNKTQITGVTCHHSSNACQLRSTRNASSCETTGFVSCIDPCNSTAPTDQQAQGVIPCLWHVRGIACIRRRARHGILKYPHPLEHAHGCMSTQLPCSGRPRMDSLKPTPQHSLQHPRRRPHLGQYCTHASPGHQPDPSWLQAAVPT